MMRTGAAVECIKREPALRRPAAGAGLDSRTAKVVDVMGQRAAFVDDRARWLGSDVVLGRDCVVMAIAGVMVIVLMLRLRLQILEG